MKGDFTRDTFDRTKHFSRVLMQQGRVQLDADWNEQAAILLHYIRTLAADIIGPYAGPRFCNGFRVFIDLATLPQDEQERLKKAGVLPLKAGDFLIGAGRYYVDGVLCENDQVTSYFNQPDLPGLKAPTVKTQLAYLRVWERHVSSIEDDYIREKALDGPDTATRAKVVWQVRLTDHRPNQTDVTGLNRDAVNQTWHDWVTQWQPANRGYLKARLKPEPPSKDPCSIAPDSRYRGAENQLYRVEIHRGGPAWPNTLKEDDGKHATFKWSRDNGSVATPLVGVEGDGLAVQSARGFVADGWVEVTDDARELQGDWESQGYAPGTFARLTKVEGDALTFDPKTRSDFDSAKNSNSTDLGQMTKVRRWEQTATGDVQLFGGVVPVREGVWIPLEDGVEVYFNPPAQGAPNTYRAGDYWLIPARAATGTIEWPEDEVAQPDGQTTLEARAMPPRGVNYHFAPLALMTYSGNAVTVTADFRCDFAPVNACGAYPYGCGDIGIGLENL